MTITYGYFNIKRRDEDHSTQHEMAIPIIYTFIQALKSKYRKIAIIAMWLKMLKYMLYLTTHKQTLVAGENIRIRKQLKHITPHMISNMMMLKFCKLELAWPSYSWQFC